MQREPFNIENLAYVEELYQQWQLDPTSVSDSWQQTFEYIQQQPAPESAVQPQQDQSLQRSQHAQEGVASGEMHQVLDQMKKQRAVDKLIMAYRDLGVLYADINPLSLYEPPAMRYLRITAQGVEQTLAIEKHGLNSNDFDTLFEVGPYFEPQHMPLLNIVMTLNNTYCSHIGYEFMHIKNQTMRNWLLKQIESPHYYGEWSKEEKIRFQKDLIKSEEFESFVQRNFVGQKRFSLEGGDVFIPALHYLLYSAVQKGIQGIVLGMSHRGRLNTFTNALRKPASETFIEFIGVNADEYGGSGDVKYHLGHSFDYVHKPTGKRLHITLCANPSHLEAVDAVVEGKARALQRIKGDKTRKKILPVLIHGDAAFAGQGVVAEVFNFSQLTGYRTGGTVHVIINNQIGFTTASKDARSSFFASSVARMLQIPIFHVNGDAPEDVMRAMGLALSWRQKFGYDAMVDIICYRKRGHNESDEPAFTHPKMYELIRNMQGVCKSYGERLDYSNVYPMEDQNKFRKQYADILKEELDKARAKQDVELPSERAFRGAWAKYSSPYSFDGIKKHVSTKTLEHVAEVLCTVPDGFQVHPKLARIIGERKDAFKLGEGIDWSFAEALSFGTLLSDGYSIRLSGEDSGRGTFSQRHSQWWDIMAEDPRMYIPLCHVGENSGQFSVYDSPLSEFSVLGFEYGYSLSQPNTLTIWEAQFGDFVNGAQVILDQFIMSGESKWFRSTGLVLLLPHGYEGQGPEHSSAHLARFLQLCADNNAQVVNATTPAQYFHLLRRQMMQSCRKPLIIMAPKKLLRFPAARSTVSELEHGQFQFVIPDPAISKPEQIVFCSGKVYYDLVERRKALQDTKTAIIRIEQLYPWPEEALRESIRGLKAKHYIWVQEEAENHGAWSFIAPRLRSLIGTEVRYVGRVASSSPSSGSFPQHQLELDRILGDAFSFVEHMENGHEQLKATAPSSTGKNTENKNTGNKSSEGKNSKKEPVNAAKKQKRGKKL